MASLVQFKRKVRRSGGSLAITIPNELLEAAGIKKGDTVILSMNDLRQIIIQKAG
jgi:antitoxin component of MazEF toxin-antitoxin module